MTAKKTTTNPVLNHSLMSLAKTLYSQGEGTFDECKKLAAKQIAEAKKAEKPKK